MRRLKLPPSCIRCLEVGHVNAECPNVADAPPVRTTSVPAGSPEHHEKIRHAALERHARRRARGESGRHPAMVPPRFLPLAPSARDDQRRYTDKPGPSTLANNPSAAELIAWRRARTREKA